MTGPAADRRDPQEPAGGGSMSDGGRGSRNENDFAIDKLAALVSRTLNMLSAR